MNEECLIIRDLIPDCAQGLVSETSRQAIMEHIPTCKKCARKWLVVSKGNPFPDAAAPAVTEERLRKAGKRCRKLHSIRFLCRAAVIAALVIGLLFIYSVSPLAEKIKDTYWYENNYMSASAGSLSEAAPDGLPEACRL